MLIGCGSWNQRAGRIARRANAAVPPHPGRTSSHLRVRTPSIYLQLQLPGDVNANPPGRYRPVRCENPSPTGRLVIGWGSSSQRAARVAPRIYAVVPPHPGRIRSHPRVSNPSTSLQLQISGDVKANLRGRYRPAGCGNPCPTGRLLIGWGFRSLLAARVAPRANTAVPPQPGRKVPINR